MTALALFARNGCAATTMGEIARDAGMAVANLCRYQVAGLAAFTRALVAESSRAGA